MSLLLLAGFHHRCAADSQQCNQAKLAANKPTSGAGRMLRLLAVEKALCHNPVKLAANRPTSGAGRMLGLLAVVKALCHMWKALSATQSHLFTHHRAPTAVRAHL